MASSAGRSTSGSATRISRSSATTMPTGCRSCRSWSATKAAICTTTSSWPCSTTCSGSSRAAAAPAPGRTAIACSASTSSARTSSSVEISRGCEGIKPGWVRVNFNYFISEPVFDFIIEAVKLVASEGWKLLPQYDFEPSSGLWRHRGELAEPPLSLDDVRYDDAGRMTWPKHRRHAGEERLADYLVEARALFASPPPRQRRPGRRWRSTTISRRCAGSRCPTRFRSEMKPGNGRE